MVNTRTKIKRIKIWIVEHREKYTLILSTNFPNPTTPPWLQKISELEGRGEGERGGEVEGEGWL